MKKECSDSRLWLCLDNQEFGDIMVAVQAKISSLRDRRERYHYAVQVDPRRDDPEFLANARMMWSERDEQRLQRLELMMADCSDTDESEMIFCEPAPAEDAEDDGVLVENITLPDAVGKTVPDLLRHLAELYCLDESGAVLLQKHVLDHAVHLLRHFRKEKAAHLETVKKMSVHVYSGHKNKEAVAQYDRLYNEIEWIIESLDDVLPYLESAFSVDFISSGPEGKTRDSDA